MSGHAPSVAFLSNIATQFGVSGEWLITGRGPMLSRDIPKHILENAQPEVLMNAVAQLVIFLNSRVNEIEQQITINKHSELKMSNSLLSKAHSTLNQNERCA
jgi:hypothetical protein